MLSPPSMSHSSRKTWRGLPFHFSLSMRFPSFRTHFLSTLLWQRNTSFSMHHSRTTRSGTKVLKVRSDVKMKRAGRTQWLARIRARLRKAPVTCGWDPFTVARGRLVLCPGGPRVHVRPWHPARQRAVERLERGFVRFANLNDGIHGD